MMKERYNMSNKEEKSCASISINWDKTIYRKFLETIENTHFFVQGFFRI